MPCSSKPTATACNKLELRPQFRSLPDLSLLPLYKPLPIEPLSTVRQLEMLRDLQRLANERHAAEQQVARAHNEGKKGAEKGHKQAVEKQSREFQQAKLALETSYEEQTQQRTENYERNRNQLQEKYRRVTEETQSRYNTGIREAAEAHKQARWQALAVFDAAKNNPRESLDEYVQQLGVKRRELDLVEQNAVQLLRNRHMWHLGLEQIASNETAEPHQAAPSSLEAAEQQFNQRVAELHAAYDRLSPLGRLFEGGWVLGIIALAIAAILLPLGLIVGWSAVGTWVGGLVGGVALGGGISAALWHRDRREATAGFEQLHQHHLAATRELEYCAAAAREKSRQDAQRLIEQRDTELAAADTQLRLARQRLEQEKASGQAHGEATYPSQISQLREQYQAETAAAEAEFRKQRDELIGQHEAKLLEKEQRFKTTLAQLEAEHTVGWAQLSEAWQTGFARISTAFDQMRAVCDERFPDWNHTEYATWPKSTEPVMAIPFGEATLELAKVKHAISSAPELAPPKSALQIPTLLTLLEQPSMVVSCEGEGRAQGGELLQTMMIRLLTAMPPGKIRFTICDPLGLGESFSSFMHLADYDEGLIHGRIWSESRDIEQRLAWLTNHMETILQKYLRNEYESIHEYNLQAGEVAEPFQVVAIANFPHGFSDEMARRLLNLLNGGPRCGIYVLLSLDTRQRLPNDFAEDDLLARSVHLEWQPQSRRFVWRYPAFEQMPLKLPEPIESQKLVELIKQVGATAKESIRVEVPFSVVVPEPDQMWSDDCADELRIPIGRTGANRLHYVRLGKGTSQHLLVAGKTGSGKSTLLHALVTSGAMHYGPDQLEFYLVDFKKGVEFKSYATHHLPHARVIAIESEREFGLSVLERLDEILRQRGEKFREAGVQNLADYRAARPAEATPRVLLVIDEFQELFVQDDRLAQAAGLLLDRLVRQGRAFGMHVLLGSQTLAGAYSLARSTLGQMAVRVALQCSEADAHLILSDERNQAARFLSRPGEAIYNDQNGLVSANQPFQVVWLPDRERAESLAQVAQLAKARGVAPPPAIVFEGNAPANPRENEELVQVLPQPSLSSEADGAGPMPSLVHRAWLGSAVAIKPPTSVNFARHGGSNLLLVGHQGGAALGMLATAAIALAAQARPGGPSLESALPGLLVFDGTRPGEGGEGVWSKVVAACGDNAKLVAPREIEKVVGQVAEELARRDSEGDERAPSIYLVLYNAARFRELRKGEEDFSFSIDRDKPPAADKQLAEILKDGPAWGIHTLVWCDSYNSVTRLFDRVALREFEIRVALQMSAADSSNFIDSPAASQLSPYRALVYNDETGQAELFRPYGIPSDEWLAELSQMSGKPAVERAK